jgi:hypothetical protein
MSEGKRMIKTENAPLNIGDMVVCKSMSDTIEGPSSEKKVKGTPGKVDDVYTVFGLKQYKIKWKVGPTLDLIDGKYCSKCNTEYPSNLDYCENKNFLHQGNFIFELLKDNLIGLNTPAKNLKNLLVPPWL